jgi:4-hydroxythreonine-4-phosphate dehydrogenase
VFDIIDAADFDADQVVYGQDIAESGRVCGVWLDDMDRRARSGVFDATVMGPISSHAMALGERLTSIATNKPETAYLLLRSGPLMIAHLCDHVPLRTVSSLITTGSVSQLIDSVNDAMTGWGLPSRRIAVAGFNPHAEGTEEHEAIRPAVRAAQVRGLTVEGPASPDSVFRHCIEGRYDVVVAMYHDQGHIAMKTWGFAGNSVVILGPPYVHTTVAHGVAYEIAGKGQADETMIRNAILNAGSLAAGRGFYE